jgi:hypothetical protein
MRDIKDLFATQNILCPTGETTFLLSDTTGTKAYLLPVMSQASKLI